MGDSHGNGRTNIRSSLGFLFDVNMRRENAFVGEGICYMTRGFGVWILAFDNWWELL